MKRIKIFIAKIIAGVLIGTSFAVPTYDLNASEMADVATSNDAYEEEIKSDVLLSGKAHIQTYADVDGIFEENQLVLGTRGQGKRVESVTIGFENNTGYEGELVYRVHRQKYGWTQWVTSGNSAGTVGEGKRLEAIEMKLTGELANHYDVLYSVHIQSYGDNQGWVSNGSLAGTTGEAKRLEELRVKIVPKNMDTTPMVSYRVHRQTYGWEKYWACDGEVSGTTGESKRLEGITISINNSSYDGGIKYSTHVQSYGWLDYVSDGNMSGTQGKAKRLEAIKIELYGELAEYYDIYYRVHAQSYGWLSWAKNGEKAGTSGMSKRLESIQIVLRPKNSMPPDNNYNGVTSNNDNSYLKMTIEQRIQIWLQNVINSYVKPYIPSDLYVTSCTYVVINSLKGLNIVAESPFIADSDAWWLEGRNITQKVVFKVDGDTIQLKDVAKRDVNNLDSFRPGDILVFRKNGYSHAFHVAIYLGKGTKAEMMAKYGLGDKDIFQYGNPVNNVQHWAIHGGMQSKDNIYISNSVKEMSNIGTLICVIALSPEGTKGNSLLKKEAE